MAPLLATSVTTESEALSVGKRKHLFGLRYGITEEILFEKQARPTLVAERIVLVLIDQLVEGTISRAWRFSETRISSKEKIDRQRTSGSCAVGY